MLFHEREQFLQAKFSQLYAARSFENFIDEAHFPWVHPYLLGDPTNVKPTPARNARRRVRIVGGFIMSVSEVKRCLPARKRA